MLRVSNIARVMPHTNNDEQLTALAITAESDPSQAANQRQTGSEPSLAQALQEPYRWEEGVTKSLNNEGDIFTGQQQGGEC